MVETYNRISRIVGGRGVPLGEIEKRDPDAVSGKFPSFSSIPLISAMDKLSRKG